MDEFCNALYKRLGYSLETQPKEGQPLHRLLGKLLFIGICNHRIGPLIPFYWYDSRTFGIAATGFPHARDGISRPLANDLQNRHNRSPFTGQAAFHLLGESPVETSY